MNDIELPPIVIDYLLPIFFAYSIAWLIQRLSDRLARQFVGISDLAPERLRMRRPRQYTIQELLSSAIGIVAYVVATVYVLGLFIESTTLIWMIGLFSAAFGIGANRLIADFLTGIGFMIEDTFDVGDKVQFQEIEGVIEKINLRTTHLRAPTGELYVVPNGEIRIIRNFSRGQFSTTTIHIKVAAKDLDTTLTALEDMKQEVVDRFPNVAEPWQIISDGSLVGGQADLTIFVKTKFAKAAEARPRLVAFLQQRLAQQNIELVE